MPVLDKLSRTPIYEQIIDGIRCEIASGILKEGSQIPSVREMSDILGVNPNTVQRSYIELDRLGYIITLAARGTYVADGACEKIKNESEDKLKKLCDDICELRDDGLSPEHILSEIEAALGLGGERK